jgi:hypothetical protein
VRDRNAGERVEQRERDPAEKPQLGVAEVDLLADPLEQDREDLAIDEVENVDAEQQPERVARVDGARRGL